jgi:hypothetical protein
MRMEVATFAALYNGFMRASDAVRCGLASGGNDEALAVADRILASDYVPYGSDHF